MAPLIGDAGGCEGSGLFAYLNTNKKSVVGDHDDLNRLIASAHAVVDDHPEPSDIPGRHPDLVFCSITPFGEGAPPGMQNAKSINVFHSSGWACTRPASPIRRCLR